MHVDKDAVLAARTVLIVPTSFAAEAASAKLSTRDRRLVANAVDRSVCIALSDRFHIVLPPQTADLTVHVTIANIVPTDETAAATTKVLDIGKSVVTSTGVVETSVPIPSVRVPIGLGGIALEGEAVDPTGQQKAAMLWAKGASSFFGNTTRVSPVGDAYELASAFGDDFSELLVTGEDPFRFQMAGTPIHAPPEVEVRRSAQRVCLRFFRAQGRDRHDRGQLWLPAGMDGQRRASRPSRTP